MNRREFLGNATTSIVGTALVPFVIKLPAPVMDERLLIDEISVTPWDHNQERDVYLDISSSSIPNACKIWFEHACSTNSTPFAGAGASRLLFTAMSVAQAPRNSIIARMRQVNYNLNEFNIIEDGQLKRFLADRFALCDFSSLFRLPEGTDFLNPNCRSPKGLFHAIP